MKKHLGMTAAIAIVAAGLLHCSPAPGNGGTSPDGGNPGSDAGTEPYDNHIEKLGRLKSPMPSTSTPSYHEGPMLSASGRCVVFTAEPRGDYFAGPTMSGAQTGYGVYLLKIPGGQIERVNVDSSGNDRPAATVNLGGGLANFNNAIHHVNPATDDCNKVVFWSYQPLAPGLAASSGAMTNSWTFVRDVSLKTTVCTSFQAPVSGASATVNFFPSISGDGKTLLFTSSDERVNPYARPGEIYQYDPLTKQIRWVEIKSRGSYSGSVSAKSTTVSGDGTHALFLTGEMALGLVASGGRAVLAVVNLATGAWETANVGSDGKLLPWYNYMAISSNGRTVAFDVLAGGEQHIYVRDLAAKTTKELPPLGDWGNSRFLHLSGNGRYVVFISERKELLPAADQAALGTTALVKQVFRHDTQTGEVLLISRGVDGKPEHFAGCDSPTTDETGKLVAFHCSPDPKSNIAADIDASDTGLYLFREPAGP